MECVSFGWSGGVWSNRFLKYVTRINQSLNMIYSEFDMQQCSKITYNSKSRHFHHESFVSHCLATVVSILFNYFILTYSFKVVNHFAECVVKKNHTSDASSSHLNSKCAIFVDFHAEFVWIRSVILTCAERKINEPFSTALKFYGSHQSSQKSPWMQPQVECTQPWLIVYVTATNSAFNAIFIFMLFSHAWRFRVQMNK